MQRTIDLKGETVEYTLRVSRRAKYLRMSVDLERGLVVTKPPLLPLFFVEKFLQEKSNWILKHFKKRDSVKDAQELKVSFHEFETNKYKALKLFRESVEFFNSFYKFSYNKISVRNQRTLWGSCSRDGNLQFNYKLTKVPTRMRDYVIVHELCHLVEHNHGPRFWALVAKTIPDYKLLRRQMRNYIM